MKVLSLFDGISCGRVALERAGIQVDRYVAYEVDKYAVSISHKNYPDIEHKGDVFKGKFSDYKGFDLLLGGSPCFTKGHYVLTDNGYKDVSEIKVGDLVYTHRKRFRKVIRTNTRITHTFKVDIEGIPSLITTKEHPFLALKHIKDNKYSSEKWVSAKDLSEGDICLEDIFKSKKSNLLNEEEAFILGRRIGGMPLNDKVILTPFFKKHLKLFSEYKQFPEFIFCESPSVRESFVKGFIQERVTVNGSEHQIILDRMDTALSIQRLILNTKNIRVDISLLEDGKYLLKFDTHSTGALGKSRLLRDFQHSQETGVQEAVYNIEVEEDQSYTVNNIIVHNCTFWSIAKKNREITSDGIGAKLFMEYVRALKESGCKWFIYENNFSIHQNIKDFISQELGVQPIVVNSSLVSAQSRKRCYWTNIYVGFLKDLGIMLTDVIEDGSIPVDSCDGKSHTMVSSYYKGTDQMTTYGANKAFQRLAIPINMAEDGKSHTIPASYAKTGENPFSEYGSERTGRQRIAVRVGQLGKGGQGQRIYSVRGKSVTISANGGGMGAKTGLYKLDLPDGDYVIRKLTPLEAERLQTLPDDYTKYGMTSLNVDIPQLLDRGLLSFCKQSQKYVFENYIASKGSYHVSLKDKKILFSDSDSTVSFDIENISDSLGNYFKALIKIVVDIVSRIPQSENYSEISMDIETNPDSVKITHLKVWNMIQVSNSQRYKCVGNGWTVDVIRHLLSGISLGRSKPLIKEQSLLDAFGIG